jgi:hypothetical protein
LLLPLPVVDSPPLEPAAGEGGSPEGGGQEEAGKGDGSRSWAVKERTNSRCAPAWLLTPLPPPSLLPLSPV